MLLLMMMMTLMASKDLTPSEKAMKTSHYWSGWDTSNLHNGTDCHLHIKIHNKGCLRELAGMS